MRPEGWIFLIVSWTVILSVFIFCMTRTLGDKNSKGKL